jgi:signal transduction histidine kinase
VEATTLRIDARIVDRTLMVVVSDTGAGADPERMTHGGTGLARLRDRLRALFGDQSQLRIETAPGRGFTATMSVPIRREREMDT